MNNNSPMLTSQQNKIEVLLHRVGGQHRYQFMVFLVFALKWLIAAMILFSLNFFYYVPDFECTTEEMADYQTCEQFVCSYDNQEFWLQHLKQPVKSSIALDYGHIMVCSKQWLSSLLQSISYLGSLVGYLIMSHIADNWGRKKGQYISWIICIIGQIILLVSFDVSLVGIGSFLMGFGANGAITIHYSFFKQLVIGKTRERMIVAIQLAFSLGISVISLLSYLIDQWKYTLAFFIIIPSLLALFIFRIVEETPQFTLKKGINDFLSSFNRIAKYNKRSPLDQVEVKEQLEHYSTSKEQNQVSYLDLFRYPSLRKIALVTAAVNFSVQFIYDGTLLSLDKFGINVYFNQILVGLVQIFAALFGVYIVPKVQRKNYATISLFIITIICIGMGIQSLTYHHQSDDFNYHTAIEMVLIAILRFVISSLWGVFFVYVSELYPNEVSSLSYGWVSIIGTVGASISPYIRLATANLTMFIMATLAFTMTILIRLLPQTKGKTIRTRILQRQKQTSTQPHNNSNQKQSTITYQEHQ